jgi:FixJ family two-component response regulator
LPSISYVAVPIKITIVDDDESVREGLSRLLSSVGFVVNTFASAEEYLSYDQPRRADCLLLDVRMPGMDGIELERQLLANHSEVPVVFITAHEEEVAPGQALDGHARTVLMKPFSEEALLNAINNVLGIEGNS